MVSISQSLTQDLEQQQQLIMMKKLLLAVCRNYWENDQTTLLSTSTKILFKEARQFYPTLNEFQHKLYQVVNQLNKREKYLPIATQLIVKLSQVYGEVTEQNQPSFHSSDAEETSVNTSLNQNSQIADIVHSFEQSNNSKRIHKMLFALSNQRWENNLETLSKYPVEQLILNIRQTYPNLERVSINLLKIVKGLNKQGIYSNIAQTIIAELAKLYHQDQDLEKLTSLVNASKQPIAQSKATPGSGTPQAKRETETRKHNFRYNPFPIRQRIMKYTNPLRAKMLLFYILNSHEMSSQQEIDELLLKTYELDTMLMQLVQTFRTIQELQNYLEITALTMASTNDRRFNVNENLQVIKAIVMSVKPLYQTT